MTTDESGALAHQSARDDVVASCHGIDVDGGATTVDLEVSYANYVKLEVWSLRGDIHTARLSPSECRELAGQLNALAAAAERFEREGDHGPE